LRLLFRKRGSAVIAFRLLRTRQRDDRKWEQVTVAIL
jgi:hypothetical protein